MSWSAELCLGGWREKCLQLCCVSQAVAIYCMAADALWLRNPSEAVLSKWYSFSLCSLKQAYGAFLSGPATHETGVLVLAINSVKSYEKQGKKNLLCFLKEFLLLGSCAEKGLILRRMLTMWAVDSERCC